MPIDEDLLDSTILDLVDKVNQNHSERIMLRNLYTNARSIQLIDVPDPTPEDTHQTKKIIPDDPKLGTEITEERRQAIYDKVISDHAKL